MAQVDLADAKVVGAAPVTLDAGELDLPYRTYDDLRVVELDLLARLRPYGADLEPRRVGDFVYLGDEPVIDLG